MQVTAKIVNAFVTEEGGGNPAAIVFPADKLSVAQKQRVAQKIGLSETAFVGSSQLADFKFDFFTPLRQIAHCGHATIAGFSYLKQKGKIKGDSSVKETIDGTRRIFFRNGKAFMEQKAPRFSYPGLEDQEKVYRALGLVHQPFSNMARIVNTGNSFLILEVENEQVLKNITPDQQAIAALSERYDLIGFYIFCLPSFAPGIDATSRMFAPGYGIDEESATGMAAGPLACYLHRFVEKKSSYRIEQGKFMRPAAASLIEVNLVLDNNKILGVYAGGIAKIMGEIVVDAG